MRNKFSLLLLMIFIGCGNSPGGKVDVQQDSGLSTELPEGFHEFYDRFHSDSTYQLEHIVFPLKGQTMRTDSVETKSIEKVYLKEDWKLHKPFKGDAGFTRNFTVMGDLVLEKMSDDMGLYTVERRWGKVDTTWSLIYYGTYEKSW